MRRLEGRKANGVREEDANGVKEREKKTITKGVSFNKRGKKVRMFS